MLTFFNITNVACSCFLDSRVISGNEFQFFIDLLRDWQTAMCLLVWHQTVWTRSTQSLEPDSGLPANASFPLSIQSRLVYTGTCYTVNTDGHQKHITNLLLTTGCYWFAPWPCPALTSSFQNYAQEQFEGQLTSPTLCKKSSLNEIIPSIPQRLLHALFDWQHQSNSFKITLWKYPRSGLPQLSGILLKLLNWRKCLQS